MSSDRNLMQFIFNHLLRSSLERGPARARYVIWLGLFLLIGLVSDTASGQGYPLTDAQVRQLDLQIHSEFPAQPRYFSDTPSPTEMMARLKYHKQQETPLFDLLREAGVDIFSKLSDDEKKLAGRFVEDMILKEGLNSEKVSSLMDQMKIGSEAKQALQEGIERAGVGDSAISPEQRKELADKIRKNFLERSEPQQNAFKSPTNRNWRQPEWPRELSSQQQALNDRLEELGIERNPSNSAAANREREIARQLELDRQTNRAGDQNNLPPSFRDNRQRTEGLPSEARKLQDDQKQFGEFTDPGAVSNPHYRQPENERTSRRPNDQVARNSNPSRNNLARTPNRGFPNNTIPPARFSQTQPAEQALNKLESQLNESQRKIVSEFRNRIQRGDISRQEIGELLQDLKKPHSSQDFARQLDEAGEKFDLPAESRQEIQQALSELSRGERSSLQQAFDGIDQGLLTQLANSSEGRGSGEPNSAGTRPSQANLESHFDSLLNEQRGKDFLKEALETYNDTESGYQLSPAFKQLKDRAEGRHSDRELANFGDLTKKLFDGSKNIFDPDAASKSRRPDGVKPGQRLDQLLAAAADKALTAGSADGENKSLFSNVLNDALGVALDQAVDIADKDKSNRNRDLPNGRRREYPAHTINQIPLNQPNNTQANSSSNSTSNPFSSSASSNNDSSIGSTAASIADTVSQIEFDGWTLMYAAGLITLLAGTVFLLFRLMPSADETSRKQRELQLKLKSNSANPKDVVEAVDLFLLSKFGATSSWWNSKYAADQIATSQPDWRDKVASLFQVYRWSRYQADGSDSVSPEQNELVKSTLQELSQAPENSLSATTPTLIADTDQSSSAHHEATS